MLGDRLKGKSDVEIQEEASKLQMSARDADHEGQDEQLAELEVDLDEKP
jgi:hypothetical protein